MNKGKKSGAGIAVLLVLTTLIAIAFRLNKETDLQIVSLNYDAQANMAMVTITNTCAIPLWVSSFLEVQGNGLRPIFPDQILKADKGSIQPYSSKTFASEAIEDFMPPRNGQEVRIVISYYRSWGKSEFQRIRWAQFFYDHHLAFLGRLIAPAKPARLDRRVSSLPSR
jgi:hypothetical protein